MYLIFYRTNDVFEVEELLSSNNIQAEITPTPVQDKAYCGVCLYTTTSMTEIKDLLNDYEYKVVEDDGK